MIEIKSDEEEGPEEPEISSAEILRMCKRLEKACLQRGGLDCQFEELFHHLC